MVTRRFAKWSWRAVAPALAIGCGANPIPVSPAPTETRTLEVAPQYRERPAAPGTGDEGDSAPQIMMR